MPRPSTRSLFALSTALITLCAAGIADARLLPPRSMPQLPGPTLVPVQGIGEEEGGGSEGETPGEGESPGEGEGEGGEYPEYPEYPEYYYDSYYDVPDGFEHDFAAPRAMLAPLAAPGAELDERLTFEIASMLEAMTMRCARVAAAYQADCMGEQLRELAERLPASGAYAEARAVLLQGADRIRAEVGAALDPRQPRLVATGQTSGVRKTYRATRADAVGRTNAAVLAILAETQTQLLRSAGNSETRRNHYRRISAALESGKVLLRS